MMKQVTGGVCAAQGFSAAGIHCGIRRNQSKRDLALIYSAVPASAAAVYTSNLVKGAPLTVTKAHLADGKAQAVICNSGNANTCNADGVAVAEEMSALTAAQLHIAPQDVIVASTGVIGQPLDLTPIRSGLPQLAAALGDHSGQAAEGIMTTDTHPKEIAVQFTAGGRTCTIGGIAKGYAADLLRAQLEKEGVTSATLDLGGDVFVMGRKTDGSDWRIAVKDPADTESYLGVVSAADKFIVTSGVYERYFEENGVRYHHILDPKTGCPAESGLVSVTVLCENGAWADALSTACFVLGPDGALALRDDLADQGTDFELILVTDDGRVRYTDGLADAFTPNDESGYTYEALA